MATITGLTAARMLEIEAQSIVDGHVDGAGHLILERFDAGTIDAGSVIGPQGPPYLNGVDTVSNQTIGGAKTFSVNIIGLGSSNKFGSGAQGANAAYVNIGDDGTGAVVSAKHGTAAYTHLELRALGALGQVQIQTDAGANLVVISNDGAMAATGVHNYFGPYAIPGGANVSRAHIQSAPSGVLIYAEGDTANRDIAIVAKGTGVHLFYGDASFTRALLDSAGKFSAVGNDHRFGPNALGGAGSALQINPSSASTISINALSTGADVQIVYNAKGAGSHIFQSSGVNKVTIDSTGQINAIGTGHQFGRGATGATGVAVRLAEDTANAYVLPVGTPAIIDLLLRPKGTGSVKIQDAAGSTNLFSADASNVVTIRNPPTANPALQNGWANLGAGWAVARYYRTAVGIVHLDGMIAHAATGTTGLLFVLPAGFRPAGDQIFLCHCAGGQCRIDVLAATGAVNLSTYFPAGANGGYVSLTGVSFSVF